jgi:hypothetical protein
MMSLSPNESIRGLSWNCWLRKKIEKKRFNARDGNPKFRNSNQMKESGEQVRNGQSNTQYIQVELTFPNQWNQFNSNEEGQKHSVIMQKEDSFVKSQNVQL